MDGDFRSVHYRTIWLSDVHLGTRGCKAELLLQFLKIHEAQTIYLVGDIVDLWRLRRAWHWPQSHNDVVQKLLRKVRKGTRVVYVPGNHDEFFREYVGHEFGGIEIRQDAMHETADGRRLLVIHGDAFDNVIRYARWLALLGDWAYDLTIALNNTLANVRWRLGYPYWSLANYLKQRVKNAVEYVTRFETILAEEARRRGADGVVCGHIHKAEIRGIGDVLYCNDGDWVESCTALVEHDDGRLEIVDWAAMIRAPAELAQQTRVPA